MADIVVDYTARDKINVLQNQLEALVDSVSRLTDAVIQKNGEIDSQLLQLDKDITNNTADVKELLESSVVYSQTIVPEDNLYGEL